MRRQLALLIVAALLPLVIARGVVETLASRDWRVSMERQGADHAEAVATLVSHDLAADVRAAEMIAQSPGFDGRLQIDRLRTLAVRLADRESSWRAISITDPQGIRILDAPKVIGGVLHGPAVDLASQQRAVRTGQPVVGRIIIGRQGHRGVAVRAPVLRGGRVVYVVSIIMDPSSFRPLLLESGLPIGWRVRLLDGHGIVAASSDTTAAPMATPSEIAGARDLETNFHSERNLGGHPEYAIWRPVAGSDWRVEVAIPRSAYEAPTVRTIVKVGATLLFALLLAGLFLLLLRRALREEGERNIAALEAQRLELLGRMTGGVAHDFNNLLTPIIGGFELLQKRVGDDPRARRLIDGGLQSAERAKALVGHLLAFARRQALQPKTVDVGRLLQGLSDLLERSLGSAVDLRLDVPRHGPWARVDPVQLELAILNLAINARDAMPEGGALTIQAQEAEPGSPLPPPLQPGRYVQVRVADTGSGMSPATLKMAVEPFFTTKPPGAGTGLGLSMVHGLAAQSGGTLRLTSVLGEGTTAELWFPLHDQVKEQAPAPNATARTSSARVLLVDDERMVLLSQAEMLREAGHQVVELDTPAKALDFVRSGEPLDLLITDFSMPLMSGAELAREVRRLRRDLPILIVTGFAGEIGVTPANTTILAKPLRRAELLDHISTLVPPG